MTNVCPKCTFLNASEEKCEICDSPLRLVVDLTSLETSTSSSSFSSSSSSSSTTSSIVSYSLKPYAAFDVDNESLQLAMKLSNEEEYLHKKQKEEDERKSREYIEKISTKRSRIEERGGGGGGGGFFFGGGGGGYNVFGGYGGVGGGGGGGSQEIIDVLSGGSKNVNLSFSGGWFWARQTNSQTNRFYDERFEEGAENTSGKWLVFMPPRYAFSALRDFYIPALSQGKLGGLLRLPEETIRDGDWKGELQKLIPFIIYVENFKNLKDVGRVLKHLRVDCYVTQILYFKTDQDTLDGIYASNYDAASIYTAKKAVANAATSSFSSDICSSRSPGKGDVLHTIVWTQGDCDAAITYNGGIRAAL